PLASSRSRLQILLEGGVRLVWSCLDSVLRQLFERGVSPHLNDTHALRAPDAIARLEFEERRVARFRQQLDVLIEEVDAERTDAVNLDDRVTLRPGEVIHLLRDERVRADRHLPEIAAREAVAGPQKPGA